MSTDFLRKHYETYAVQHASSNSVLANAIQTSRFALDKRQAINNYTPAYAAALLLHPSYREAYINKQWPMSWRAPAIAAASTLWTTQYKNKIKAVQAVSSEEESNKLVQWQASLRHTSLVHIAEEFVHFTKSLPVLIDDALQWWLEPTHQLNYPNLAQMAIDILSINPMSAESERVFSGCRRTLSWNRASLSATNLGYIECLKTWQKNLCFETVDLPVEEGDEVAKEEQDEQDEQEEQGDYVDRQGDPSEGQGHSDDDDEVGIGIVPLDNLYGMLY
ncbi:hypothetical protein KCU73_g291, partial [Aureobasidium melanogenum]